MHDLFVDRLAAAVEVLDELDDTPFVLEGFLLARAVVEEDDSHALVEVSQLLQAAVQNVGIELQVAEDFVIGLESGLGAGRVRGAETSHLRDRLAALVFLVIDVAAAADLDLAPLATGN